MTIQDRHAGVNEASVEYRLKQIRKYLGDFRQGKPSSVVVPLWNLRALQDEMRLAGHRDLAELCRWMEGGVMRLQMGSDDNPEKLRAEIGEMGDYIKRRIHELHCGPMVLPANRPERMKEASIA